MSRAKLRRRFMLWVVALCLLTVTIAVINISLGEMHLSPQQLLKALLGQANRQDELVLWQFRAPGVAMSVIVGAALALSGAIFQRLTGNDLADSSILGINAGASFGAVLFLAASQIGLQLSETVGLPIFALIGAGITALLVFNISQGQSPLGLLLGGVAVGTLLNGLILLIQLQVSQEDFEKVIVWISGSFWNLDWSYIGLLAGAFVVVFAGGLLSLHNSDLLTLGHRGAASLGLEYDKKRRQLMIFGILLAAIGVAGGGAIGFVGLMAPHIAQRLVGSKGRYYLPLTMFIGVDLLMIADVVAANLFAPSQLPVGLVVAMITVPYFIVLMLHQKK
ncbi:ferrichrome transport system permease protein FhuG [Agrilactobacillus composti DSM 18527 = JCM 14202]|nr:iron ABC transporter permease [Agrilactobacillus composti]GAF39570.1 ferrichrome transport system permease protein FhuG [Agrilactobacillus composti DSM 18527 = JCM 14202]